jgi:pilus assembly protein CpaB
VPAKTILTVLFLISLSVVVMLALRALPQAAKGDRMAKDKVLVASAALTAGTLLRAKDVVWQPNVGIAQPGQIVRPPSTGDNPNEELDEQARGEVYGTALRTSIAAGEPISRSIVVKPGDRDFLQVALSPHTRAISISVASSGASAGSLYPGDRVDVILTQTFKTDPSLARRSVGEIVVQSLRVLAVDPLDARANASANGFGRNVTLEVTPEQAERINVAAELGRLSLATRVATAGGATPDSTVGPAETAEIKPIWAGDVSRALGDAAPAKAVMAEQPSVEIIRGTKTVLVNSQ